MKKLHRIFTLLAVLFVATTGQVCAEWVHCGLYFTYIYCFTGIPDGAGGTSLFTGSDGYGVYLSTNNGEDWTAVNTGLTNKHIFALAVNGTNLFAGTYGGGVFRSTNNGTSWIPINTGLGDKVVRSFIFPPDGSGGTSLLAGTDDGVFTSTNNGTSWTEINNGLTNKKVRSLAFYTDGSGDTKLFAGTYGGGVFLSGNNGSSWTAVNSGLTNTDVFTLAVSGTNLFAGTYGGGVFISGNNGSSWTAVNSGLANKSVLILAISGTNLFAGTVGGVFLSTNNGTSWIEVNTGLGNKVIHDLIKSPDGSGGTNLFAGTNGDGVYRRPLSEMITSVQTLSGCLPSHFRLEQNYPNPFNPSTQIEYDVEASCKVNLIIYNLNGQVVKELVDSYQQPGKYSINFNMQEIPSGIYFYKIQMGNFQAVKKMMKVE